MTTKNVFQSDALKQPFDQMVTNAMASQIKLDSTSFNFERDRLRDVLLQGAQAASSGFADEAYFTALRSSINPVV